MPTVSYELEKEDGMRRALKAAAALVAMAATFAAVAAGGTASATQRVRIETTGSDPFAFVLRPMSQGGIRRDAGQMKVCCWTSRYVVRAGARLEVTDPHMTFIGKQGTLKVRLRIEWVSLPDGWSVVAGTWKVVGGTGAYASLSGRGRVAGVTTTNRYIRVRLFGSLESR